MNIVDFARNMFTEVRGSHGWDHTLRVVRLCERIGRVEQADMEVLIPAAYLHDIGRKQEDESQGRFCHAECGAKLAEPLVWTLDLTPGQKINILHCIRSHRFRNAQTPETPEAKILFDADKLDSIGAIGIGRAFLFAGEIGARLHCPEVPVEETRPYTPEDTAYREYRIKLQYIRDRLMTREGKKLAEARHQFMTYYFEQFLFEYEGRK